MSGNSHYLHYTETLIVISNLTCTIPLPVTESNTLRDCADPTQSESGINLNDNYNYINVLHYI